MYRFCWIISSLTGIYKNILFTIIRWEWMGVTRWLSLRPYTQKKNNFRRCLNIVPDLAQLFFDAWLTHCKKTISIRLLIFEFYIIYGLKMADFELFLKNFYSRRTEKASSCVHKATRLSYKLSVKLTEKGKHYYFFAMDLIMW